MQKDGNHNCITKEQHPFLKESKDKVTMSVYKSLKQSINLSYPANESSTDANWKRCLIQKVQKRISRYFKVAIKYNLLKTTKFRQFLLHLINPLKDIIQTAYPYTIQNRGRHKLGGNSRTVIAKEQREKLQCQFTRASNRLCQAWGGGQVWTFCIPQMYHQQMQIEM